MEWYITTGKTSAMKGKKTAAVSLTVRGSSLGGVWRDCLANRKAVINISDVL